MNRIPRLTSLTLAFTVLLAGSAFAQTAAVPRLEIGVLPGGATLFQSADDGAPDFFTYATVGSVTFNVNRFVGVEGEVGGNFGIDQSIDFQPTSFGSVSAKPPHSVSYAGSVVIHPGGRDRRAGVYVAGGGGGLTLFERVEVGVPDDATLFVGHVGGGAKVAVTDRWGIRADYRFLFLPTQDETPLFLGSEDRFGHRFTAGFFVNVK